MANELLTGMLSQPKGPAAPGTTQNSYGGTVPSPVAQPPQTPGFQNNTANPQWWGGAGGGTAPMGATSGYGSSTPTPYTPPSDDTVDDTVDDTATEATGTTTGAAPKDPARERLEKNVRDMIAMHTKQLMQHRVWQSSYRQGSDQWQKYARMIYSLQMQIEQQQARLKY